MPFTCLACWLPWINDSQPSKPLKDLRVSLTPPQGWKPTHAWLVGAERHRPFVEAVVGQIRRNDGREEPYLERLCEATGTPSAANVRRYAEIVRDRAILRRLLPEGVFFWVLVALISAP